MLASDSAAGLSSADSKAPDSLQLEEGEVLSDHSGLPVFYSIMLKSRQTLTTSTCFAGLPAFPSYPVGSAEVNQLIEAVSPVGMHPWPTVDRRLLNGPVPAAGTPQNRFAATLGLPHSTNGTAVDIPIVQPTVAMNNLSPYQPTYSASLGMTRPNYSQMPFDTHKQGGNISKGSGRGPARPPPGSPATQWLSYECQRRHFNPDINVVQQADGTYRCNIVMQNHVVQSNKSFDDPQVAKVHTAAKAHEIVQRWPLSGFSSPTYAAPPKKAAGVKVVAPGANPEGHDHSRRQQELRAQLLKNKQRLQSKDGERRSQAKDLGTQPVFTGFPSSEVDMTNPIEARAFVEGYKMGQLAAMRDAQ